MIQTGLIDNAHNDLVTDAAYDFYGTRLATCSIDQRIKIWQLDETSGTWNAQDDWRAHDAAVSKVSWAHPEFGSIIASSSFDRTFKVWEQAPAEANGSPTIRWIERAVLHDARGTVRAVEFAPHQFGLKLATISSDNYLRVYECLEQPSLVTWQVCEEIDILSLSPHSFSRLHNTQAVSTPTPQSGDNTAPTASLVAQALQNQGLSLQPLTGKGTANREADGGWCVSWCKDQYWGEVLAAGAGVTGTVKIIQLSPSKRPQTILTLDPSPEQHYHPHTRTVSESGPHPDTTQTLQQSAYAITTVAWAPSCGRSYHLVATGGRDGHVRIWKLKPPSLDEAEDEQDDVDAEDQWSCMMVADFDQHKSAVGRVEWNITGTTLSSAGNDGCIRLWKATSGNVWRPAGSIGIEQVEEGPADSEDNDDQANKDVDMAP